MKPTKIQTYINRIRNKGKKAYAQACYEAKIAGNEYPYNYKEYGVSAMGAQSVWWQLTDLLIKEKVVFFDPLTASTYNNDTHEICCPYCGSWTAFDDLHVSLFDPSDVHCPLCMYDKEYEETRNVFE